MKTNYQRILVAIDFSDHSAAALKQAVWLARQTGASITLAHTLPDLRRVVHSASARAKLDLLYGEGDSFQREVRKESDAKMRQLIADLGAADLDVRYETLLGEPFVELTHAVQSEQYDLVLAGTRGLSAWEQFFVGSTAKRLTRQSPASVWIVKAEHSEPPQVVLAPTDFSPVSLKAAAQGLRIAQQAGAQFHVLHVIDSQDIPEDVVAKSAQASALRSEINEEATSRMGAFLDSLQVDHAKVQSHLSWGTPWKEVKRVAEHFSADLIAMGTVGRSGLQGILLGNTAEKILDRCACSVLTVKPDGFVSSIQPASWPLHPET